MSNKSKTKGSNFERALCKILSEELGGSFVRVPNSGSMIGGMNNHRVKTLSETQIKIFRGDIIPPDNLPKLVIECKAYKGFRFHQIFQAQGCSVLNTWIKQTTDIINEQDQWFVIFHINLLGWYIVVPEKECKDYTFNNYGMYTSPNGLVRITEMMNFLQNNNKKIVEKSS